LFLDLTKNYTNPIFFAIGFQMLLCSLNQKFQSRNFALNATVKWWIPSAYWLVYWLQWLVAGLLGYFL